MFFLGMTAARLLNKKCRNVFINVNKWAYLNVFVNNNKYFLNYCLSIQIPSN